MVTVGTFRDIDIYSVRDKTSWTPPHCETEKNAALMWSSLQKKKRAVLSFFPLLRCFNKRFLPNLTVILDIANRVVFHLTLLIYGCNFIAYVNVLILLCNMGGAVLSIFLTVNQI